MAARRSGSETRAGPAQHGEDERACASLEDARGGGKEGVWKKVEFDDVDEWKADDEQCPLLDAGHSVHCADAISLSDNRRLLVPLLSYRTRPHLRRSPSAFRWRIAAHRLQALTFWANEIGCYTQRIRNTTTGKQDKRKVLGQPISVSNSVYIAMVIPMSVGQKMKTKRNFKRSRSTVGRCPEPGLVAAALLGVCCKCDSGPWPSSRVEIDGAVADVCTVEYVD